MVFIFDHNITNYLVYMSTWKVYSAGDDDECYLHGRLPQQHAASVQHVAGDVVQQPREDQEQRLVGRADDEHVPHGERGREDAAYLTDLCGDGTWKTVY